MNYYIVCLLIILMFILLGILYLLSEIRNLLELFLDNMTSDIFGGFDD